MKERSSEERRERDRRASKSTWRILFEAAKRCSREARSEREGGSKAMVLESRTRRLRAPQGGEDCASRWGSDEGKVREAREFR